MRVLLAIVVVMSVLPDNAKEMPTSTVAKKVFIEILVSSWVLSFTEFFVCVRAGTPCECEKDQCKGVAYQYCCEEGIPCLCSEPENAPGQCGADAYKYCCKEGSPCNCSSVLNAPFND